jgi:hypothetical protein
MNNFSYSSSNNGSLAKAMDNKINGQLRRQQAGSRKANVGNIKEGGNGMLAANRTGKAIDRCRT